jgi:uncharacterized protein YukE
MTGIDAGLGFAVTPENVLDAYAVIAEEAERLRQSVQAFSYSIERGMGLCGGDPVSSDASRGFTAAGEQLKQRCQADADRLSAVADNLAQIAHQYGKTEDQLATAFSPTNYRFRHEPILPSAGSLPPGHQDAWRGRFR